MTQVLLFIFLIGKLDVKFCVLYFLCIDVDNHKQFVAQNMRTVSQATTIAFER